MKPGKTKTSILDQNVNFFGNMRPGLLLIFCTGLWSCSKTDNRASIQEDSIATEKTYTALSLEEYRNLYKLDSYLSKTDDSKIETVDFDCAILIYPTDGQNEELKKTLGDENFNVAAEENNLHQKMAIQMIDSMRIEKITPGGQYLRLKGENKTWDLDIRKDNLPSWNLIFFKRTKEPQIIPAVSLTVNQIRDYFEIKK